MGDEEIGEERREEIEQEYEYDDPHGIERGVDIFGMFDVFFARYECDYVGAIYEEKTGDTDSENKQRLVRLGYITQKSFTVDFFDSIGKKREHGIQEYGSEHHSDLDDLHGNRIESDGSIGYGSGFEYGQEDDVDLEIEDIQEECESVGERCREDMFGVFFIEAKPYRYYLSRIHIEHDGHDDITEEPGYENPREHDRISKLWLQYMHIIYPDALRTEDIYEEHHRDEIHRLSDRCGHEGEFRFQKCLEHGHDGRVHEPEEREYSGDEDTDERWNGIISRQEESYDERDDYNCESHHGPQRQDGSGDHFHLFFIVLVLADLTDTDGIEPEVGYDREYGEIVVYLGIEPISCHIEIVREYLYEEYRNERR